MKIVYSFLASALMYWTSLAFSAGGVVSSPTGTAPDRYAYYPGTEELAKEEIRVIACGTGSMANIAALMIPYQYLDKVFLSHLHTDHMGDILGLWAVAGLQDAPTHCRFGGLVSSTTSIRSL